MKRVILCIFACSILLISFSGCRDNTKNIGNIILDVKAQATINRLVFVSMRDGSKNIYSMNSDGTDQKRLTNSQANDQEPCWSPDGKYIAFSREVSSVSEIFVMNSDGSNVQKLTNHKTATGGPAWSPDGKSIAYHIWNKNNFEIFVTSLVDGHTYNLTKSPHTETYPDWSPDGTKIVFHSENSNGWDIHLINSDGSQRKQLTDNPNESWLPTWKPDGSKIAFWSTRSGFWEIYLMNPDGSEQIQITKLTSFVDTWISRATWSPDGKSLAIAAKMNYENYDIIKINSIDGEETRLTKSIGEDSDPIWTSK